MSGFGGYVLQVLMAIWPLFALIIAGHLMRRWQFPSETFWPGAERLNYFILFPALLVASLVNAPLDNPAMPRLALGVFTALGIGWVSLLILRRVCKCLRLVSGYSARRSCASTPTWAWPLSATCSVPKAWALRRCCWR